MAGCGFPRKQSLKRPILGLFVITLAYFLVLKLITEEVGNNTSSRDTLLQDESFEQHVEEEFNQFVAHHSDHQSLESDLVSNARIIVENLPDAELILNIKRRDYRQPKCARFPDLYDLEFSNVHWQVQRVQNVTFYLYRAYYDNRISKSSVPRPVVRIMAMANEVLNINVPLTCQLWYPLATTPVVSQVTYDPLWFVKWSVKGRYTGFILTCPIPIHDDDIYSTKEEIYPVSISIVGQSCDNATNNLNIVNERESSISSQNLEMQKQPDKIKLRFGVCVKGLDFLHDDKSVRLVEWIELLFLLGVEKVFFYEYTVHPNIKKVLNYYVSTGKVDVSPFSLPGTFPNEPNLRHLFLSHKKHNSDKRKIEVIPYNDCLYRNLNNFDWLAVLDTDEVIMPKVGRTWGDLISLVDSLLTEENKTKPISTYCFRNLYFFDNIPEEENGKTLANDIPLHLHMLKHIYSSANFTPPAKFIKCLHSAKETKRVHNHFPLGCLNGKCHIHHTSIDIAQLQHYRSTCVKDLKDCAEYEKSTIKDVTIWKYKDELTKNVNYVLSHLQLNV